MKNKLKSLLIQSLILGLAGCGGGTGRNTPAVNPNSYTIGGSVSGLNGAVVLQNNGSDDKSLSANGSFTFASALADNSSYLVTVKTQPAGQTCTVSTGSGQVSGGNVSNVAVTCSNNAYNVGGTVSGLNGSVVLQDNGGDTLGLSADGSFTFATPVAYGSPYAVTVLTQPSASMSCSVANGTGTMGAANVGNVGITCAINHYTVGGTVSRLKGSVVLQNNGADDHTVSVNGPFQLPTTVSHNTAYDISILNQPLGQSCEVSAGSGIATANVTDVGVACVDFMGNAVLTGPLNLSGTVSTLAGTTQVGRDGVGAAARFSNTVGSAVVNGFLYQVDYQNSTIRKIEIATGTVTTLAGQAGVAGHVDGVGAAATFYKPQAIAATPDGTTLFVTEGWPDNIRKIDIATGTVATLGQLNGTLAGIATDGTSLYVTVRQTYNNSIAKIDIATGNSTRLAGSGVASSVDGVGIAASFRSPFGIAYDGGSLYVTDDYDGIIRKIDIATASVTTLAGQAGFGGSADGTGSAALFNSPQSIATDGTALYVEDVMNGTIRKVDIATTAVTTLAGTVGVYGSTDGIGPAASFMLGEPGRQGLFIPGGISTDGSSVFIGDGANKLVRKIDIATAAVTTLAGSRAGADGVGGQASFSSIGGVTSDGTSLYIADSDNYTIRKVDISTGAVTTLAGTAGVRGSADGIGAAALFMYPEGITTDGTSLYVADESVIRKIDIATGIVTTFAGTVGVTGGGDGVGATASFNWPSSITSDGRSLYVVDDSAVIRKIDIATATVTTLAGQAGVWGSADGIGALATFNCANGITTDGTSLYVADGCDNTIRKVDIASAAVTTVAGQLGVMGPVDGTGLAASFSSPVGITTDGSSLYVADRNNRAIRQIDIATMAVSTLIASSIQGYADGAGGVAAFFNVMQLATDGSSLYVRDSNWSPSMTEASIRKIQ